MFYLRLYLFFNIVVSLPFMDKSFVSNIKTHLSESKKIVVVPHLSPDADAIGSCLAIYHFFNKDHEVSIISPNEYSEVLKFLPGENIIYRFDLSQDKSVKLINDAEIIFILDFINLNRERKFFNKNYIDK